MNADTAAGLRKRVASTRAAAFILLLGAISLFAGMTRSTQRRTAAFAIFNAVYGSAWFAASA
jgi:hypothetical protein